MIGKFTGNNTSACGFSIGFERIVMLLLERGYQIPTAKTKKAYLIEKNMPSDKLIEIFRQAEEERKTGVQVNISIMKMCIRYRLCAYRTASWYFQDQSRAG